MVEKKIPQVRLRNGLEVLSANPKIAKDWGRCGLLSNQASVDSFFQSSINVCQQVLGERLRSLFSPQHGYFGCEQDNMIETPDVIHPATGLPMFSLYSRVRRPTESMLSGIDTLIIDLQIVGCRIYTYKASVRECLLACKEHKKKVVILDRPNPLGGITLEGRCPTPENFSFVGPYAMPMRHGLSMGEAALLFNQDIGTDLEVVRLEAWQPEAMWADLVRTWVLTSPNLAREDALYLYPGTVIFEGTNVSEGRGTGLAFLQIGAPYIKSEEALVKRFHDLYPQPAGVTIRPTQFAPTSGKWAGTHCRGVHFIPTEPSQIRSYMLSVALMRAFMDLSNGAFEFKEPPYEYEYIKQPMKIILGADDFLHHLENFDLNDAFWYDGINAYKENAQKILLYPRTLLGG